MKLQKDGTFTLNNPLITDAQFRDALSMHNFAPQDTPQHLVDAAESAGKRLGLSPEEINDALNDALGG